MNKRRKRREQWAPERVPDELFPEPPSDDPSHPFWQHVNDNPTFGDRIWLHPELEAEPSLDRWLDAILAIDDERRKDQTRLAVLLNSDHPLRQHARGHLANFIDRYQERDALAQLLAKLQSGARLSRDDRLALADMLERQPWKKTKGNRPASYEMRDENAALGRASAAVDNLRGQGTELKEKLDRLVAKVMSLEQALDRVKNRTWIDKDTTLKERVAELRSQGLNPRQIKDKLVGQGWVRDDRTIAEALTKMTVNELARQRGWISEEMVPERTVKQAVDELMMSEGLSLEKAVDRLTSQRWTIDEAADRVSKWQNIPGKTLRNYCNKGRPSLRPRK
jgi:SOS response regulatory protein OraA/RecX